jgi:hypothetical protein
MKLVGLHLVSNALLLWLAYLWLGIGEPTVPRLIFSFADALAIVALVCWLHGTTLVYLVGQAPVPAPLSPSFRTALRNLLPLLIAAVAVVALYGLLSWWADASGKPAFRLASWLTLKLRKPIKPATVTRIFNAGFWIIRWWILPVVLLPVAAAVANRGWRGFGAIGRRGWHYWLEVPLLLLCAFWLPFRIFGWVPKAGGFGMEMASFVVRIGAAYLLFVAAVLVLELLTSRGKPILSQPKTVTSP